MSWVIKPFSIPLFGTVAIHGYGIAIAVGIGLLFWCIYRKTSGVYPTEVVSSIMSQSLLIGWMGGRILHFITENGSYGHWYELFTVWRGGFSVLGGIVALVIFIPLRLKQHNIALLPALDIPALYGPIAHAIGRLGCLWAGCCFGCVTTSGLSVIYAHGARQAPLGVPLVPSQLYSAACFILLFLILYYISRRSLRPGALACGYLIGMSAERFFIDFIRNDRILAGNSVLSLHQWFALAIAACATVWLLYLYRDYLKSFISSQRAL